MLSRHFLQSRADCAPGRRHRRDCGKCSFLPVCRPGAAVRRRELLRHSRELPLFAGEPGPGGPKQALSKSQVTEAGRSAVLARAAREALCPLCNSSGPAASTQSELQTRANPFSFPACQAGSGCVLCPAGSAPTFYPDFLFNPRWGSLSSLAGEQRTRFLCARFLSARRRLLHLAFTDAHLHFKTICKRILFPLGFASPAPAPPKQQGHCRISRTSLWFLCC